MAAQRPQHRGLAGAVGAEHRRNPAVLDLEIDSAQRPRRAVAGLEALDVQRSARSTGAPQIGAHHLAIGPHLVGPPVGDDPAEVERDHLVADPHDQIHVMLDEEHRDAAPVADGADLVGQPVDLLVVEAGGRFVEEQELRTHGERARQLHPLAHAERQLPRRTVRDPFQAEFLDQRIGALGDPALLAPRQRRRQRIGEEAAARDRVRADAHVLAYGHGENSARFWKVRATPSEAISCLAKRRERAAVEQDRPGAADRRGARCS